MKKLYPILLIFAFIYSFSTNNKVDSLHKELNSSTVDTIKLRLMDELSKDFFYSNPDSSIFYALKVIEKGTILNSKKRKLSSINRIGLIKLNQANYKDAIDYFLKALTIAEDENDTTKIAYIYNNIGISYSELKDYQNSEKYLLLALEHFNSTKNHEGSIGIIYNNLSIIAEHKEDYKNQYKYLNAAILEYETSKDYVNLAVAKINLASYFQNREEYQKAILLLAESIKMLQVEESYYYLARSFLALATIYNNDDKNKLSIENLKKSMELCEKYKLPDVEKECYKLYADIYQEQNKFKEAYEFFNKYSELKDSLLNETKQKQISELNIKYETVKKDKEISILNKEQELQKEKINTQKKLLIGLLILVVLIVIFSVILFLLKRRQFLSYKNLVKKNIEIIEKETQIDKVEINKSINDKKEIPEIAKSNKAEEQQDDSKYTHSTLNQEQKEELAAIVLLSMKKEKLFLDKELTLDKLAQKIGVNRTYLSQIINESFNKNFSSFINEFRIKEATKILINNKTLTIEAIADEVGFKSKSAFNSAFKLYTGVTPTFFIKNSTDKK